MMQFIRLNRHIAKRVSVVESQRYKDTLHSQSASTLHLKENLTIFITILNSSHKQQPTSQWSSQPSSPHISPQPCHISAGAQQVYAQVSYRHHEYQSTVTDSITAGAAAAFQSFAYGGATPAMPGTFATLTSWAMTLLPVA